MNFRVFTAFANGEKLAVNVRFVAGVRVDNNGGTAILLSTRATVCVKEDFDTVVSRLNTIAE